MRAVKIFVFLILILTEATVVWAGEMKSRTLRADLKNVMMNKPISAKKFYREAWGHDNLAQMSILEQLEYFQKNNPGFDEDTMAIVARGTEMMKKMDFGLEGTELETQLGNIKKTPARAIQNLSENARTEATPVDALSIMDLVESVEKMSKKMYKPESLSEKVHHINIEEF